MSTTFNLNRFILLTKWETLTEKKDYIRCTVGVAIALTFLFCIYILSLKMHGFNSQSLADREYIFYHLIHSLGGMAVMTLFFSLTLGASFIFMNMRNKQQRIAYLMQPSSNLEKYLARYLHVTIGYFLCLCVSLIFADIMQYLFSLAILEGGFAKSVIAWIFSPEDNNFNVNGIEFPMIYLYVGFITMCIHVNSFWVFCGTLYRRNAWLFTLCTQFVLGFLLIFININVFDYMSLIFSNMTEYNYHYFFWTGVILSWALSALLYWGSYKLFCRMQVINNKWLNI